MAGALQEDADTPVVVARILGRQALHGLDDQGILGRQTKHVTQARARQAYQPAGAPLGQAAFVCERDRLAARLWARHFLH
jgi:hypothetical protein